MLGKTLVWRVSLPPLLLTEPSLALDPSVLCNAARLFSTPLASIVRASRCPAPVLRAFTRLLRPVRLHPLPTLAVLHLRLAQALPPRRLLVPTALLHPLATALPFLPQPLVAALLHQSAPVLLRRSPPLLVTAARPPRLPLVAALLHQFTPAAPLLLPRLLALAAPLPRLATALLFLHHLPTPAVPQFLPPPLAPALPCRPRLLVTAARQPPLRPTPALPQRLPRLLIPAVLRYLHPLVTSV
ncbi:hypothetical protein FB45DRAFT_886805 [Roridomyces roridus]|uniref:Uncharacterized protein n=1 Tax=Roridomyces roridus TaxID=1738132 RepID=A0AAD7CIP1_9AGAR|nr:hypothetical protein FB45DRAFT_886805 [Roridomyces roridus]